MTQIQRRRSNARGFTLLEALIALLVLSFGMLAIAGFQTTLTRSSDLAKQRTEAMRLAQQKMETLRAFGQVATDPTTGSGHKFNYTDDVISSTAPEVFTTNATFSRTWTVAANAADSEKWINVTVAWNDRTGQPQSAQLQSVISKFDPQSVGTLATGPGGTNVRKPKNRNLNIPYPAIGLSGGTRSAFSPPPGGVTYVFDNVTGDIVQSCTGLAATPAVTIGSVAYVAGVVTVTTTGHTFRANNRVTIAGVGVAAFNGTFTVNLNPTANTFAYDLGSLPSPTTWSGTGATATLVVTQLTEGFDLAAAIAGSTGVVCQGESAYLLSGYVRFDTGNNPTGEEPNTVGGNNATLALSAATPLSLDTTNQPITNGQPSMVCYAQRQQVVSIANPSTIAITSLLRTANTGTVTVTAPSHGFSDGQTVAINATSSVAFIGAFVVATVPTVNTFTYTLPPPEPIPTTATSGTAQLVQRLTIAEGTSVTGYSNVVARFISYACVVTPVNHDNDGGATPLRWWGRVTLNTNAAWTIGTASGNYKVCRFSADYNGNGAIANAEHPQWYRGVTGSLDSQNYLVIAQSQNCPTERAANPFSNQRADYSDDTTALQQPYTSTGVFSFQCPAGGCGTPNTLEPTTTATDLLMD